MILAYYTSKLIHLSSHLKKLLLDVDGEYHKELELVKKPKTLQSAQREMNIYTATLPSWFRNHCGRVAREYGSYKQTMSSGHDREGAQMNSQVMSKHTQDLCKPSRTNPSLDKAARHEVSPVGMLASLAAGRDRVIVL